MTISAKHLRTQIRDGFPNLFWNVRLNKDRTQRFPNQPYQPKSDQKLFND